ncbi:MAG TPA: glycoside hydrolase family 99-like domain-containing protein [Candidatus Limnocylindrales bacterium]|nr:glycoside hydrolase family 99-like domain-containing protein [Candidatus Limnocylindrales bacterium]
MLTTRSILICAEHPPESDRDSGSRRLSHIIELLRLERWEISFLATHGIDKPALARGLQQQGIAVWDGRRIAAEELLADGSFDLALFSTWSVAEIFIPMLRREAPLTRAVVDSVDLHFLRSARRLFAGSGGLNDPYGKDLVRELNVYAAADAVLTVSQKEACLLSDLVGPTVSIQVLHDMEPEESISFKLPTRRGILFLGSFRHHPNLDAVEFLCREIVPRLDASLLEQHPVTIIGDEPNHTVRQIASGLRNVQIVGWVPSVLPYLARARISVVPLRYGAGTKRKLLQSLLLGTPVVSTGIGAEGFGLRGGKHLLIADQSDDFAAAITHLLKDDLLWKRLSRDGKTRLRLTHGREAGLCRFSEILNTVLDGSPKVSSRTTIPTAQKPARMDGQKYESMRAELQELVRNSLPADAKIIVVSRGDEELLKLNGCKSWHFPQTPDGQYAGHYPATSAEAIAQLESLRQKGAEFLLFPATALWWLEHYQEFRAHLESNYREVVRREETCIVYECKGQRSGQAPTYLSASANGDQGHSTADKNLEMQAGSYRQMLATARGNTDSNFVPFVESLRTSSDPAVKCVAFYLPQFHSIPENDAWWGKGFTEWTNVSKATPQFAGHYQPHLPGELGFYDLRVPEIQRRQVELARKYGVHGFCFYYYWFAGRRLLEKPLNQFMSDPAIDFPFCLCWANENWTRRWDGKEEEILLAQNHCPETDRVFIQDIEPILRHRNYIRVQGRPVLVVYRARLFPDPASTARLWREYCRAQGLPNPYLVVAQVFEKIDPREIGFDAAVEFPPNTPGPRVELTQKLPLANPEYTGTIYRYSDLLELTAGSPSPAYPLFRTVCPSWDNEARRPGRGSTYAGSSPAEYRRWLDLACKKTLAEAAPENRFVFVNAWNEWGEGAHLEPDRRYGYAYLQATSDVLNALPKRPISDAGAWTILFVSHDAHRAGAQLVLLKLLAWLKRHTSLRLKVLCLEGGEWLYRFQELADTIVWSELAKNHIAEQLLAFCGGKPGLVYANSVASGRVYDVLHELGTPIVAHFHEMEMSINRYAQNWIKEVLKHSTHFVACSTPVRENLVARHGVSPEKVSTIYASIEIEPNCCPKNDSERVHLRHALGFPLDKLVVVGCGLGMPHRKGADLFIEVAKQLKRLGRHDFHFYWIGELDPTGLEAQHLNALRKSTEEFVTFLGTKDDSKLLFQAADIFLLTSREDPFPLAALEAAACGLPIVCFNEAGGMPDFVERDAGCVVPFEDVQAMAREVALLMDDHQRRHRLGARGREKLLANYTIEKTCPQLFNISRRVAGYKPAVSIVVPNYNHGRYLRKRLHGIFNQTFKDFEVLLLDDNSTDNSLTIVREFENAPNIRVVANELNSGSTFKQWLKGIDLAQGDTIWIAESDDDCESDFLERLLPAFQNPHVKLAYCNSHVIDEQGTAIGDYTNCPYLANLSKIKWNHDYRCSATQEINDGLGVKNTILSASSVLFKRFELASDARRILERMRLAGDWYFFIHAIAGGEVAYTSRKLNHHRRHSESVIGKLLRDNRVNDFFHEFYLVQSAIINQYQLDDEFATKWKAYLQEQWQAFFPNRAFDELNQYYPLERLQAQLCPAPKKEDPVPLLTEAA